MTEIEDRIVEVLSPYLSAITVKSIWKRSLVWSNVDVNNLRHGDEVRLIREMEKGIRVYLRDPAVQKDCTDRLGCVLQSSLSTPEDTSSALLIQIRDESDIVLARGGAAAICRRMGFPKTVEVKVATAVSELSRNIVQYGGGGEIAVTPLKGDMQGVEIVAKDFGPGISNLEDVLSGNYQSRHGMGMGLRGTKNLMDAFEVETGPDRGTQITIRKYLTPWK
jgi:serine/threonine-protein kinase RsbT